MTMDYVNKIVLVIFLLFQISCGRLYKSVYMVALAGHKEFYVIVFYANLINIMCCYINS